MLEHQQGKAGSAPVPQRPWRPRVSAPHQHSNVRLRLCQNLNLLIKKNIQYMASSLSSTERYAGMSFTSETSGDLYSS